MVIIEIQSNRMQDYLMRMLFGTSKLIVDNLDKGMGYNEIRKVISVNIVYFDLGHGKDYIYYGTTNFTGMHMHDVLELSQDQEKVYHTNQISKLYPEYYIIKVNQFNDVAKDSLDEWIYFLKNVEIRDDFKAKGLKEAKEGLDILKLSDEDRIDYESFIKDWRDFNSYTVGNFNAGLLIGEEKGIKIGEEIGIKIGEERERKLAVEKVKKQQLEIARKCRAKGMNILDIAELTGLSEEEIHTLN